MRKEMEGPQTMQEEFLHYLWKKGFEKKSLNSVSGEKVIVMNTGEHNRDAGPDFLNAIIRIGDTTWAGCVEIHVRASDWYRHGHEKDEAYDNVILHAVYDYDKPVCRPSGEEIPVVVLKGHIPRKAYSAYLDFLNNHLWIPCANEIGRVPLNIVQSRLEELCIHRINRRALHVEQLLEENKGDWNQAFFISLAGSLGTRVNKDPMELLARQTPVQILLKYRADVYLLESLLFGQSGMLNEPLKDDYAIGLLNDYLHLKIKYSLEGIPAHLWKFLRLRPVSFPTIRLAQLAAIYHQCPLPLGMMVDEKDPAQWDRLFMVNVSDYWKKHYQFDREAPAIDKKIGQDTIDLIMINTVVPILYVFGKFHDNQNLSSSVIHKLTGISPESNHITRSFDTFGLRFTNAMQTQGCLELKKYWCDQRRCLDCAIGHELLKIAL
jgi:hypothetical protein